MSDFDLPDLPSDEELGITDEDREEYGKDLPEDDGPELSEEEMAALLGDAPARGGTAEPQKGDEAAKKAAKEREKKAKRERKKARKAVKKAAREETKRAKAAAKAKKAGVTGEAGPAAGGPGGEGGAGETGGGPVGDAGTGGGGDDGPVGPTGPSALAPMPGWRGPVTLLLLAALSLFASSRTGQVEPAPANTDESDFSSARAMSILNDIARQAHPTGSPEHARVRDMLVDRLEQLGLEPEVQTATTLLERRGSISGDPALARAATVRNVVARIPGSNPTGAVLITAHYDSREIAVGAGDDGSGVVTILEAIRALQTGPPVRNDVIVLLTDAEELGLLGARAFVDRHPWMPDVDLVLSFEMRGGGGPSIMFETNERNGWVVRGLQAYDPHPFANSMSYEVYERMPRDTDFTPFREAGVQGLNFAGIDNAHVYHQVYDTPDNLSESTLQHHGVHALEGLRYFGNADLTSVDDANVVFFSVPALGLIVYDGIWVLAISVLLVIAFVLMVAAARRADARPGRVAVGAGVAVVTMVLAYLIGDVTFGWLTGLHPEYGALQGSAFHSEGWYMLSLVFMALLLVVGSATLVHRWVSPLELAVGALVLPLLAALAAGFVAPLAAMNLQWPVAAAILSVTVMALLQSRGSGLVGWIVALILVVPVVLLLHFVIELLWLAMSLELAGMLAVLVVVGSLLCLPLLLSLEAPNRWWAPLTLAVLSGACLGSGILGSGASPTTPMPSTLVYAYEHGADSAVWATSPGEPAVVDGTPWAEQRVSGSFSGSHSLEAFGYRSDSVPTAPARVLLADPPAVEVVTDTVLGGARRAVLHVRSRIGAEMLGFQLEGETRLTSINGEPLSNVEELRWIDHWGAPDSAVVLDLTMPPGMPIDVDVVEHLLRPEELLGRDAFSRPRSLAPDITWLSDRAMFRYSVARFADPRHATDEDILTPPPNTGVPEELIEIRSDTLDAPADTGAVGDTSTTTDDPGGDTATVDTSAVADTAGVPLPDSGGVSRPGPGGVGTPDSGGRP